MASNNERVAVEVRASSSALVDVFALYQRAVARWGEANVCLLESAAGPDRDCRLSLVAADPCLGLELVGERLSFFGEPSVVTHAVRSCANLPGVSLEEGAVSLLEPSALWACLRALAAGFEVIGAQAAAQQFGFLGYFGYDIAGAIEKLPRTIAPGRDVPTLCLRIYRTLLINEHATRTTTVVTSRAHGLWHEESADVVSALVSREPAAAPGAAPVARAAVSIVETMTKEQFTAKTRQALEHIRVGDIYQVQIGYEIRVHSELAPLEVYKRLRQRNPSPYMYLAPFNGVTLVGASPELFFQLEAGDVTMRPIAGTAPRSGVEAEDQAREAALLADPKERAEHVMLVDLCRNDVGRICEPGSLQVPSLMYLERFSHVSHIVSTVVARTRADVDVWDIVAATFPAGTMTGAPKVRAMQIIEDLELSRRGAYAGAVGMVGFTGPVNLALCIRSAVHRDGVYSLRASAGVVADSTPEAEWRETRHKMASTYWAVVGEEIAR